jgi:hypothetical protein
MYYFQGLKPKQGSKRRPNSELPKKNYELLAIFSEIMLDNRAKKCVFLVIISFNIKIKNKQGNRISYFRQHPISAKCETRAKPIQVFPAWKQCIRVTNLEIIRTLTLARLLICHSKTKAISHWSSLQQKKVSVNKLPSPLLTNYHFLQAFITHTNPLSFSAGI